MLKKTFSAVEGTLTPERRVSRDEVILAFRVILGRSPEDEKVIRNHQVDSLEELRIVLLTSAEFSEKYAALEKLHSAG